MRISCLLSALLALDSRFTGVSAQLAVEYNFNNAANPTQNDGGSGVLTNSALSQGFTTLDGNPYPTGSNGISFSSGAATFAGEGCLYIPDSESINLPTSAISNRTIEIDFKWDGDSANNGDPQMLFEQGGKTNGISIYLRSFSASTAELFMAVWETNKKILSSRFVKTNIEANKWYKATLVLHRFLRPNQKNGTLTGYLNDHPFAKQDVDFFGIRKHGNKATCLGGMKSSTLIFGDHGTPDPKGPDGLYFRGQIRNFKYYTSVERPVISNIRAQTTTSTPTARPTLAPTTSPTSTPTTSPTSAPTAMPTTSPTTSAPTSPPTVLSTTSMPSESPTPPPVVSPSSTVAPTTFMPTTSLPTTFAPTTAMPTTSPPSSLVPTSTPPTALPTTSMPTSTSPTPSLRRRTRA